MLRTHTCGELREEHIDNIVSLCGWVNSRRDHGNLIFIDVRDRYGITQVVFNPQQDRTLHKKAESLRPEDVICVKGIVRQRPEGTENEKLSTGKIEVLAKELTVLNKSLTPPFQISNEAKVSEEMRFEYRFLDLRRPILQEKLILRHRLCMGVRSFLDKEGFVEIETPILTKSTPEGARDYLVPSRLNPGCFFALPQSPQLFKQILMVSGFEKYFQIARCFRDEDLRADRQPEFTQLDMEMSFITEEDIFDICERLVKYMTGEVLGVDLQIPFPRIEYDDAIRRFGTDKPDTRFGMELIELTEEFIDTEFRIFKEARSEGNGIVGLILKGVKAEYSRAKLDELIAISKEFGASGLVYFIFEDEKVVSPVSKFFKKESLFRLKQRLEIESTDLLLVVADKKELAYEVMGKIRLYIAKRHNLIQEDRFSFLWVVGFPLFKYNEEEKRWETEHHPFTAPRPNTLEELKKPLHTIKANSYDLVFNGTEIASGSIRIHNREIQKRMFDLIGLTENEINERFGFLLKAFEYGAPPHGGIAFGLDRLVAMFTHSETIREVIAFPKTQRGYCPMTGAPSGVAERQLRELSIKSMVLKK